MDGFNYKKYGLLLEKYINQSKVESGRLINKTFIDDQFNRLNLDELDFEEPLTSYELEEFLKTYFNANLKLHHPHYMAHQVSTPSLYSSVADMINGSLNNGMAVYEMGMPGTAIELKLIDWLLSFVGWQGTGSFTSGGSIANLTAVHAARVHSDSKAWENGTDPNSILLCSESSHYSITRTASIMGMGSKNIVTLPTDDFGKILVHKVNEVVEEVLKNGKKPIALVANACSTTTGLFDDLYSLGEICNENKIWFHVDGAHGASFLISDKYKDLLNGIEKADSLTWDAHKMMATSHLCTALLFKNKNAFDRVFSQKASYLKHDDEKESFDLFNRTIECTKPPIGLKLLLPLLGEGLSGIRSRMERLIETNLKLYRNLESSTDFEVPYIPESNILIFRYLGDRDPGNSDLNSLQRTIQKKLLESGEFFITAPNWNDKIYLRTVIMNPLTDENHLEKLLRMIREIVSEL